MPRRRTRRSERVERALPPMLDRLIYAEEHRGETTRAVALAAFGRLAMATIPTSGVFAPADDEQLYKLIEDIAHKQLGFTTLRDAIKEALSTVRDLSERDAIEVAYTEFLTASDQAYFYAGLAFGAALAAFADPSWR